MSAIVVSAVVLRDRDGRVLMVRKRGTRRFMFPGGKLEAGESAEDAARRECAEELGVDLDPLLLEELGTFTAAAANEDGHTVTATVFQYPVIPIADPGAEIEELRWTHPGGHLPGDLAPLATHEVFPALVRGVHNVPSGDDNHRLER